MALLKSTATTNLRDFITPTDQVFAVAHFDIPSRQPWRDLELRGTVACPRDISVQALQNLPQTEVTAVHECAGNPLRPTLPVRRVANVIWRGVLLRELVRLCKPLSTVNYICGVGADGGVYRPTGVHVPHYQKDLPLSSVLAFDAMVALEVNGAPLEPINGGPLRLVIPGFYGTNHVKWLHKLEFSKTKSESYFSKVLYNDLIDGKRMPVWEIAPHSIIVEPSTSVSLHSDSIMIWGWAWSAYPIESVEVSTDGGVTWNQAGVEPRIDYSWQRFQYIWKCARIGRVEFVCRAIDVKGREQPPSGARNRWSAQTVQIGRHGSEQNSKNPPSSKNI